MLKQLGTRTLFTLVALFFIIQYSSAIITSDSDWTKKEEITLEWGDNYSTGDFIIQAESFDKPAVKMILAIYRDNEEIHSDIMSSGSTTEVSTIRITVNAIEGCGGETETPYATLTVYTMKPPHITLDAAHKITEEGLAKITIELKNTGGIRFYNITLDTTLPDDLIPYKDDSNTYQTSFDSVIQEPGISIVSSKLENISVGLTKTRWINVEIPALPQNIEIPVHISAQGYDLDKKLYKTSKDINIIIEPAIIVRKIPMHRMVSNDDEYFHMNDRVWVWISIFNSATTDASNVIVNESIMTSNFVMDPDSELDWTLDLSPRESVSFNYYLRPVRPGEIKLSKTKISREYKGHLYINTLESTTAKIYGPYLEISKTLDKYEVLPGGIVTVSVVAKNTGNYAAYVELTDEIPDFARLLKGTLNNKKVVKPGGNLLIGYSLIMEKEGEFRFPAAVGEYNDQRHYGGTAYSTRPLIQIQESNQATAMTADVDESAVINGLNSNNNSTQTDSDSIPGFGFLIGLVVLMLTHYVIPGVQGRK